MSAGLNVKLSTLLLKYACVCVRHAHKRTGIQTENIKSLCALYFLLLLLLQVTGHCWYLLFLLLLLPLLLLLALLHVYTLYILMWRICAAIVLSSISWIFWGFRRLKDSKNKQQKKTLRTANFTHCVLQTKNKKKAREKLIYVALACVFVLMWMSVALLCMCTWPLFFWTNFKA